MKRALLKQEMMSPLSQLIAYVLLEMNSDLQTHVQRASQTHLPGTH